MLRQASGSLCHAWWPSSWHMEATWFPWHCWAVALCCSEAQPCLSHPCVHHSAHALCRLCGRACGWRGPRGRWAVGLFGNWRHHSNSTAVCLAAVLLPGFNTQSEQHDQLCSVLETTTKASSAFLPCWVMCYPLGRKKKNSSAWCSGRLSENLPFLCHNYLCQPCSPGRFFVYQSMPWSMTLPLPWLFCPSWGLHLQSWQAHCF